MVALTNTDELFTRSQQDLLLVRIGTASGDRKFRATIRRNAYDFQGHGRVEIWTPAGWTEVVTLGGAHPVMAELPTYVERDDEKCIKALRSVARMLETQAEEIAR